MVGEWHYETPLESLTFRPVIELIHFLLISLLGAYLGLIGLIASVPEGTFRKSLKNIS